MKTIETTRRVAAHLDQLATAAIDPAADLWPQVRARVAADGRPAAGRRRRVPALLGAALLALALALGALTPVGARATNELLGVIGLRPTAVSVGEPVCTSGSARLAPTLQQVETPLPPGMTPPPGATAGLMVVCPEGYEVQIVGK